MRLWLSTRALVGALGCCALYPRCARRPGRDCFFPCVFPPPPLRLPLPMPRQTGKGKDKRAVVEGLQIASTRDAAPVKFSGDATAQVAVDGTADRTGNKFTGCASWAVRGWTRSGFFLFFVCLFVCFVSFFFGGGGQGRGVPRHSGAAS
jgi:hypothetical protein